MTRDEMEEVKRHFDVVGESLRSDIQVLAEGHTLLQDELKAFRSEVASSFREVRQETGEIKAAIRLSYAEIDRRIRTLEGAVVSLADRVDRLEARKA